MHAISLLEKYFTCQNEGLAIVLEHSRLVAAKAVAIARALNAPLLDLRLVEEAALLHDIGVSRTHAPDIGCRGEAPYICHGILGKDILDAEGLPLHALACERHIGVGLTAADIVAQKLPLPPRDMVPLTMEEKIICFADLFFSKTPGKLRKEKTLAEVRKGLGKFGERKVNIFEAWVMELTGN